MDLNWTKSQAAEVGVTLLEMPLLAPVARARPKLLQFPGSRQRRGFGLSPVTNYYSCTSRVG